MTDDPELSPPDQLRRGLLEMLGLLEPITEMVVGYRASLEAAGYSSVSADRIATDVHQRLVAAAFAGVPK